MTENKRFTLKYINEQHISANLYDNKTFIGAIGIGEELIVELLNDLSDENEQLKNKIDVLEDDNETYYKSLEQLNLYTKRFIPTKCTNEFKDCKTNRYYWLDLEGNFEGCLELLNLLDCERELLESENRQLKGRLMEYEEQIKSDEMSKRFKNDDCGQKIPRGARMTNCPPKRKTKKYIMGAKLVKRG